MKKIYYLYAANFIAAFLLFQIELIVAKILLPRFGGSYLVWGSCVVFFQFVLLLGYIYSHVIVRTIGILSYKKFHLLLILFPLLFFPGRPLEVSYANNTFPLVLDVFLQLITGIGPVFFVLSTISLISQSWLSASELPEQRNPYPLYAVSNVGSFAALLSYPFLFEYHYDLSQQLIFWRVGYAIFLIAYFAAFFAIKIVKNGMAEMAGGSPGEVFTGDSGRKVVLEDKARWFLLAAAATVIFLSVTNVITYEVAPCPLLWIVPLAIYLLSFILVFQERPKCPKWIVEKQHIIIGFCTALFFLTRMQYMSAVFLFIAYLASLFLLCMASQYELYRTRPRDKQGLTIFYVIISTGSFFGGILATWVAPLVLVEPSEYLGGLLLLSMGMALGRKKEMRGFGHLVLIPILVALLLFGPILFINNSIVSMGIFLASVILIFSKLHKRPLAVPLALSAIICVSPIYSAPESPLSDAVASHRNYYGIYHVHYTQDNMRLFVHGMTVHGIQLLDQSRENEPTSYFHVNTPVGKLLSSPVFRFKRIGVVGLGVGTLAAYGSRGQEIDFYELDPDIRKFVDRHFTFLKNSKAKVNVFYGDARINLARSDAKYDVLVVDAFSGDSVPVHLLTTDATKEFKEHLTQDGIILFHVTNKYFDFVPVVCGDAVALHAYALADKNPWMKSWMYYSQWVAVTWDEKRRDSLVYLLGWKEAEKGIKIRKIRPWTDGYSSLFSVFKREAVFGF